MSDLRTIDLNLLVDPNALLTTRSVTGAARQLNLSQSAMSGSPARLRKLFDDPLFVRNVGGWRRPRGPRRSPSRSVRS